MRLRVQSRPPLPSFKAWFSTESIQSISDLKHLISTSINVKDTNLALELDAFDLLDSSALAHILRDNDLIIVKQKSKTVDWADERPPKRPRLAPAPSPSTSSSSSSSSSSSDSDSTTSSDSDSDSSSSESEPETQSSRKPALPRTAPLKTSITNGHTVPPGMGSESTKDRNARRRKKRLMEKVTSAGPNPTPLPTPLPLMEALPRQTTQPFITPSISANLHNKNKRKGFKQSMSGQTSQRIVFEETNEIPPPSKSFHRITPPSEQQNLPSNVFVTSVDVEEGLWPTQRDNPRKRPREEEQVPNTYEEEAIVLDYGPKEDSSQIQPEEIESKFDSLSPVQAEVTYTPNTLLAFKELDIDPATLTPQEILKLARLQSQEGTQCEVQLVNNSVGVASFGREVMIDENDEESMLSISITDMQANGWKVVV